MNQTDTTVTEVPAADAATTTTTQVEGNVAGATVAAATTPAAPAVVVPKAPSKKSLAVAIFAAALADRAAGKFDSNKAFRAAVLAKIQADLGVSVASAATMYNSAKQEAEAADATVALGRDPKKEKAPVAAGKRGRPAGSKNKEKAAVAADPAVATTETAPVAEVVVTATADESGVVLTAVEGEPAAEVETAPAEAAPAEAEATA